MFHSARLKLTAWYLLIIMAISVTFSCVIYRGLVSELERFERAQRFRIERRLQQGEGFPIDAPLRPAPLLLPVSAELVQEAKQRILFMLIMVNTGILVVAGGLGYMLAGSTLRPIKRMMDEQNRFISDASHELKTPLTSLKSAFEVYLRHTGRTLQEADTIVQESISEVNKLQFLSESMLQLAQYQHSNGQASFVLVPMNEVITEAIKKVNPMAKQKHIALRTTLKQTDVLGHKDSLVNLFVILFDNAIKYSHVDSVVSTTMQRTDGWVVVSVKDHGIGIEAADIPHVFDRFYRADAARSKSIDGGYGLGLAIAKKIIDAHKGVITVESTPKKGSIFTVRLPASDSR